MESLKFENHPSSCSKTEQTEVSKILQEPLSLLNRIEHLSTSTYNLIQSLIRELEHRSEETSIINFFDQLSLDLPNKLIHLIYSKSTPKPTEDGIHESNSDPIIGLLKTFSRFGNSREVFLGITSTISNICRQDAFSDDDDDDDDDDDSLQGFSQPLISIGFILMMIEVLSIVLIRILKTSKKPISFFQTYSQTIIKLLKNLSTCSSAYQHLKLFHDQCSLIYESNQSLKTQIQTFLLLSIHLTLYEKRLISSGRICFMKKFSTWNPSLKRIITLDHQTMKTVKTIDDEESERICNLLGEIRLKFDFDRILKSDEFEKEMEAANELSIGYVASEEGMKKILRSNRFLIYAMSQYERWKETGSIDSSIEINETILIEALENSDTNMIQAGIFIIISSSAPLHRQDFKLMDCLATRSVTIFSAELRFLCFRTLVHLIESLEFKTRFDCLIHLFKIGQKYIKLEKALVNWVKEKMAGCLSKEEEDQKFWWSKEWVLRVLELIRCDEEIDSQNLELVIEKVNLVYFLLRSNFETRTGLQDDEIKEKFTKDLIQPASKFLKTFHIDEEVNEVDKSKVLMMLDSLRFSLSLINSIDPNK